MEKYTLIRTRRRSLAIQIIRDGTLIIRAPLLMPKFVIEQFITSKQNWIEKHQTRLKEKEQKQPQKNFSEDEIIDLKIRLSKYIVPRVHELWQSKGLPSYKSIKVTCSEKRWGSCSGKNNLCFSYRLGEYIDTNPRVIDAIIFHEIAHLKEKNHSKKFWNIVYGLCPNYEAVIANIH